MHILGLCNGSIHGNSEILLKAALKAAVAKVPSVTVSWIHVPSVVIPRNPRPLRIDHAVVPNHSKDGTNNSRSMETDDREAIYNAVMDADALIIATPVYSHQPAGTLKWLSDYVLGPYADVSKAFRMRCKQESDDASVQHIPIDPREIKPRVAGFLAVAGSGAPFAEQWTMALPTMHLVTYSIHAKVIDQIVMPGFAHAGSVLADPPRSIERARLLGQRVASQMGKPYDEAEYLGPEEEGSCPYCHLLKIEFCEGNNVVCIVCGAHGQLRTGAGGEMRPVWEEHSRFSSMTLEGKWLHLDDVEEQLNLEKPKLPQIEVERKQWEEVHIPLVDLPSMRDDQIGSVTSSGDYTVTRYRSSV